MSATAAKPTVAAPVGRIRTALHFRMREYLIASFIFLILTVAFFNPIFRGYNFSYVGSSQNAMFPWAARPNYLAVTAYFPQSDQAFAFYPWQVYIDGALRHGSLPLWLPHSFGGVPFLANGTTGLLYPPRVALSLLLLADGIHNVFVLLHVFFASLAMFMLLKEYGAGFAGALLAGIAWMFNSFGMSWAHLEHVLVVTALLPLACLCIHRAGMRQSWGATVGAGITLGMIGLGANAEFTFMTYFVCLVYAGLLTLRDVVPFVRQRAWRATLRLLAQPVALVSLTVGIAAVQLFPTFGLLTQNARESFSYDAYVQQWLVPPHTYWNALRHPALPLTASQMGFEMMFVGLPTALLAIIGFFARRPGAGFGRALGLTILLMTTGTPVTWIIFHLVPGFGGIRPIGRTLFLWEFAIAILGGIGLDACLRWARAPHGPLRGGLGTRPVIRRLAAHIQRYDKKPRYIATCGVAALSILVTSAQLIRYDREINPPFEPRQPQYNYPKTPLISAIEADGARFTGAERQRIFPIQRSLIDVVWTQPTLFAGNHLLYGFDSGAGYESILPRRTTDLWRVVQGSTPQQVFDQKLRGAYVPNYYPAKVRFDLLPRVGVTTVIASPDITQDPNWTPARYAPLQLREAYTGYDGRVYDIVESSPRAYLVYDAETATTPFAALQRFTDPAFDWRHRVIFEGTSPQGAATAGAAPPTGGVGSAVEVRRYGVNDMSLAVRAERAGWVVVADMWAPGWHAWVNGRASEVARADYTLRAVAVPAGESRVDLSYRPVEFVVGAATTAVTVGLLLACFIYTKREWLNARPALPDERASTA